jgi:hypothetical protein
MSITNRSMIFIALVISSMFVLAACGDSDSDSQSSDSAGTGGSGGSSIVAAEPTLESEGVGDDVATPVAEREPPPAVSVVALEVPEAGSQEEALLNALDRQVTSINTQDWSEFVAQCAPNELLNSVKQVKYTFEEFGGAFGHNMPDFNIYGYNARAVEFRIYSTTNARTTFDIFDHDEWIATGVSRTWVNVDGVWLGDGVECYA